MSPQTLTPAQYFAGSEAWEPVTSSNVHSIAYYGQGKDGILGVRFIDKRTGGAGAEYRYAGVEVETYQNFLNAPSKGQFVWQRLRDRYVVQGPI